MRLLLVEDDRALIKALRRGLGAHGFAVDAAGSAEEARELARVGSYDVVILDLGLPGADGLSFLRDLRAEENSVPVLTQLAGPSGRRVRRRRDSSRRRRGGGYRRAPRACVLGFARRCRHRGGGNPGVDSGRRERRGPLPAAGAELDEALVEAGHIRLRPILMTSLAAVAGLAPLAFGIGAGSEMQQPLAIAILGGVSVSMIFSLLGVPLIYRLLASRSGATGPLSGC